MAWKRAKMATTDHEVVKRTIITPNFGQSPVTLGGDKGSVASRPGPVRVPDSSAPQPPGAQPTGPVELRVRFNPQSLRVGSSPARFFYAHSSVMAERRGCPAQGQA